MESDFKTLIDADQVIVTEVQVGRGRSKTIVTVVTQDGQLNYTCPRPVISKVSDECDQGLDQ